MVQVSINGRFRGSFVLRGALRPEVKPMLAALSASHVLMLLSGDHDRERQSFQSLFGHGATLRFGQSPADKLAAIEELQAAGRSVMMVGDGLNDAGALRQSDVGVAVVEEVGAFSPASDIILEARNVPALAALVRFSRGTVSVVWASILLSLSYNIVGLAFATTGRLSPIVCAILMPLSSITVVTFACAAVGWASRRAGLATVLNQETKS
jgi:Cu+-exporting ATPase